jgi:DNA-binding transcriptional ArsR family regulator
MLGRRSSELDKTFHALAHPVRRAILKRIAKHERTVTELAEPFDMTLEGVSQHIRVLERAGLLRRKRSGRLHRCRLDPAPLKDAAAVLSTLSRYWEGRLDALDRYLQETLRTEKS